MTPVLVETVIVVGSDTVVGLLISLLSFFLNTNSVLLASF